MENWEKLKSADIRTVKRDELIDITRIPKMIQTVKIKKCR